MRAAHEILPDNRWHSPHIKDSLDFRNLQADRHSTERLRAPSVRTQSPEGLGV